MQSVAPSLIAPIARWSMWEHRTMHEGAVSSPDVSFVEPMLRRRLSSFTRMALRVAYDCAHDVPDVRFVFASRHGELTRTTTMLEAMASKEDLSPTAFSLSVLNASTGLFSMLEKNFAPSTAVSAGCSSFGYGLLEACIQLRETPEQSVLLVYADEPIPDIYGELEQPEGCVQAIGLLLQTSAVTRIGCTITSANAVSSDEVQSRAFLRGLEVGEANWFGDGKLWSWKRVNRC